MAAGTTASSPSSRRSPRYTSQTTAMALVALQRRTATVRPHGLDFLAGSGGRARRPDDGAGRSSLPFHGASTTAPPAVRIGQDRTASIVPRSHRGACLGGARDGPGRAARAAERARVSLTRRQLARAYRARRRRGWAQAECSADRKLGAFDGARPSTASLRRTGSLAVAVLRADLRTDLEGLLADGLRVIDVDGRGRSVVSSRTSSSSTWARRSTPTREWSSRPRTRLRRLGAALCPVADRPPPRHRGRRVEAGLLDALDDAGRRLRRPQRGFGRARTASNALHRPRRALGADDPARRGRRRVDAEAQDPSLGRRHAVAEELLRLHARPCLRVAEGRVPHANVPRSIVDIAATIRPSLVIIDGIVGMEGDGPIRGDADPLPASSSSRVIPSRRT